MKPQRTLQILIGICLLVMLVSCAPDPTCAEDLALQDEAGFWRGILHGFLLPFAVIGKIFNVDAGLYAINNTGTWYWVGYFIGFAVLGGGMFRGGRSRK